MSGDKFFENKINEKEGKFIDVSESSGIYSSPLGYGLAITTADINNDGLLSMIDIIKARQSVLLDFNMLSIIALAINHFENNNLID